MRRTGEKGVTALLSGAGEGARGSLIALLAANGVAFVLALLGFLRAADVFPKVSVDAWSHLRERRALG